MKQSEKFLEALQVGEFKALEQDCMSRKTKKIHKHPPFPEM